MKTEKFEVKSARKSELKPDGTRERKVVAVIDLVIYDSADEMEKALGRDRVFELANAQNQTNQKNAARAAAVDEPSEKKLYNDALQRLVCDPAGLAALQAASSDPTNTGNPAVDEVNKASNAARFKAVVDAEIAKMRAEQGLPAPTASEDEEVAPSA